MVFSTIIFLLRFLPITLALYYLAPPKLKNTVLFLCSLVFYCWGEVRFFPVMLALILMAGIRERLDTCRVPKALMGTPIALIMAGLMSLAFMAFKGMTS